MHIRAEFPLKRGMIHASLYVGNDATRKSTGIGRKSFQKKYGIDFEAVIKRLNKQYGE